MSNCTSGDCVAFPNATIYNQEGAFQPLYFAYSAYCQEQNLYKWDCKYCSKASSKFNVINVLSTDYLQVFIGYDFNTNRIVISFRGTHNYEDWFKDIEYKQIKYPAIENAWVHEGFYNAYNELAKYGLIQSFQESINKYSLITNTILLTGHSMGSALAELCALDIIQNQYINLNKYYIQIYTFGSPRWGNKILTQYLNNFKNIIISWRIVNKNDPVAIVPGKFLGSYGFYHVATEILYTDYANLKYRVCDGSGEDVECSYNLWTEEENVHLWYLNVYENCGVDTYGPLKDNNNPSNNDNNNYQIYGNTRNVSHSNWQLSTMLVFIGFICSILYYFIAKFCLKRNGYDQIPDQLKKQQDGIQSS